MIFNLVFVIALFSGVLYLLNSKFPEVLANNHNYSYIIQAAVIFIFIALGFLSRRSNFKIILQHLSIWLVVILMLLSGYSFKYNLKQYGNKILGHLIPSMGTEKEDGSVTFYASQNGHFMISAEVNQKPVKFLLDTGASRVTLSAQDAKKLGINLKSLQFDIQISTANGMTKVAQLKLPEIKIGRITVYNVESYVSNEGLDTSLLGMSFLNKLKRYEVEHDAITFWN